jgi:hypothetical protein
VVHVMRDAEDLGQDSNFTGEEQADYRRIK